MNALPEFAVSIEAAVDGKHDLSTLIPVLVIGIQRAQVLGRRRLKTRYIPHGQKCRASSPTKV
ncbi:hypothetical protein ATY76_03235 [Rhizobium sp. R339]|nr:hypothetical protein ATY76_03235 [Rhizobium sp. R339]